MQTWCRFLVTLLAIAGVAVGQSGAARAEPLSDLDVARLSRDVVFGSLKMQTSALKQLSERGKHDVVATLILAVRFRPKDAEILAALSKLTQAKIANWNAAMLWQEARPGIKPHASYAGLKQEVLARIDPTFLWFLNGQRSRPENMKIRLEEIVWGGVRVDGIPSLDNPKLITAKEANYLDADDLVFGVSINGDTRAYPLRIMGWHEMFNETIGNVPVALAYCTLCGAGILFETHAPGRKRPLVFGSSGFLYRSNKLMFDRETGSLWNQFTGKPIMGPLVKSGIALKIRPVTITTWAKWLARHPATKVLSLKTGHARDYGSDVVYAAYFASDKLMFPAIVGDETVVRRKDFVFGIRTLGAARAWPLKAFAAQRVINDAVGATKIVLIGDAKSRTVRAFERKTFTFQAGTSADQLAGPGGIWKVGEDQLLGPGGEKLARVAGHISYWFAWNGYLGSIGTLYTDKRKP